MSDPSGKSLEQLVRSIEEFLLPKGFKVEPNEKVFDDSGNQIAEFDITISGTVGSSSIRWLIECRDRPSEGAAPGSWIQQLSGRKQQFKFDKVFAVSTTGFSPAAVNAAESGNIVLRTVETVNEIKADFQIVGLAFELEEMEFIGPMNGELEDPKKTVDVQVRNPLIKHVRDFHFEPLPIFVSRNRNPLHPRFIDGGVELLYFWDKGWVDVLIENQPVRVKNFRVPLMLTSRVISSRALVGRVYAEGDRTIWAEASFEADSKNGKIKSRMQIFKHPDGRMSARFFNDAVPEGLFVDSIKIYGLRENEK